MADYDSSLIKIGPAGNRSGTVFDYKGSDDLVQIFISHGDRINWIQFQYTDDTAPRLLSKRIGSDQDGNNFHVVKLACPSEYITCVSGHIINKRESDAGHVRSIKFRTNRGEYGPFGRFGERDEEFTLSIGDENQFGGFHGTADSDGLKSIGVYLKPVVGGFTWYDGVTVTSLNHGGGERKALASNRSEEMNEMETSMGMFLEDDDTSCSV